MLPVFHRLKKSFPDDWEKTVASNNVLSIAHALNNLINNIIIFVGSKYILLSREKITIPKWLTPVDLKGHPKECRRCLQTGISVNVWIEYLILPSKLDFKES